jgi:hypothetical protein
MVFFGMIVDPLPSWFYFAKSKLGLEIVHPKTRITTIKPSQMKIMCGVVEMNKEAEWAKTAPYCELHRPTRRYTHSNRNIVLPS